MKELLENLRDRMVDIEAQQQVFYALFAASVATHPDPARWREAFAERVERLKAHDLQQALPESWLEAQDALRQALFAEFDRAIAALG